ncbi:hypothetical protein Bbelb_325190 [Branchiostoma belcheri]|nr:hypothetical protein Bbelb_325190 [Branchiostoma belcheri]
MHRREILRLPLDGGIIPGYAQAPKLPSYRFKTLVKDEMTGKETEEMLLVVDLSVGKAQIVHVKPPPDTPSSGPGTAVGRGQEVNLRSVPVYMQRPSAKNGHNGAHDSQRAPEQTVHVKPPPDTLSSPETTNVCIPSPETSIPGPGRAVRPVTPPETDVTAVPGTADATKPM